MEEANAITVDCYVSTPAFISLYACDPGLAEEDKDLHNDHYNSRVSDVEVLLKNKDSVFFLPALEHNNLVTISSMSQQLKALVLKSVVKEDTYYIYSGGTNIYHSIHKLMKCMNVHYFMGGHYEMVHFPFTITKKKNLGPDSKCYFASSGEGGVSTATITLLPGVIKGCTDTQYMIEVDMSLNSRDKFKTFVYKPKELVFPESDMVAYA